MPPCRRAVRPGAAADESARLGPSLPASPPPEPGRGCQVSGAGPGGRGPGGGAGRARPGAEARRRPAADNAGSGGSLLAAGRRAEGALRGGSWGLSLGSGPGRPRREHPGGLACFVNASGAGEPAASRRCPAAAPHNSHPPLPSPQGAQPCPRGALLPTAPLCCVRLALLQVCPCG